MCGPLKLLQFLVLGLVGINGQPPWRLAGEMEVMIALTAVASRRSCVVEVGMLHRRQELF